MTHNGVPLVAEKPHFVSSSQSYVTLYLHLLIYMNNGNIFDWLSRYIKVLRIIIIFNEDISMAYFVNIQCFLYSFLSYVANPSLDQSTYLDQRTSVVGLHLVVSGDICIPCSKDVLWSKYTQYFDQSTGRTWFKQMAVKLKY